MLFIGDSTVEQAASVLMNSVQMGYRGTGETSCATSISVADADTLFHLDLGRYNRGWTVPDAIREARQPEIVVLSAGAHVYGQDNFTRLLRHVAGSARRITRNASLIWMTTLPGGCGTSSLDEPPAATPGFWTALGARAAVAAHAHTQVLCVRQSRRCWWTAARCAGDPCALNSV